MIVAFVVGFSVGIASAALFAELVRAFETRAAKIPNCPHIPPPPRPASNQRSMSDYL